MHFVGVNPPAVTPNPAYIPLEFLGWVDWGMLDPENPLTLQNCYRESNIPPKLHTLKYQSPVSTFWGKSWNRQAFQPCNYSYFWWWRRWLNNHSLTSRSGTPSAGICLWWWRWRSSNFDNLRLILTNQVRGMVFVWSGSKHQKQKLLNCLMIEFLHSQLCVLVLNFF